MPTATLARQTIPRWSLRPDAAPLPQARSATIIPLPTRAARHRRVLTYPAAIIVPARLPSAPDALAPPFCAMSLLALLAPTLLLGGVVLVANLLA